MFTLSTAYKCHLKLSFVQQMSKLKCLWKPILWWLEQYICQLCSMMAFKYANSSLIFKNKCENWPTAASILILYNKNKERPTRNYGYIMSRDPASTRIFSGSFEQAFDQVSQFKLFIVNSKFFISYKVQLHHSESPVLINKLCITNRTNSALTELSKPANKWTNTTKSVVHCSWIYQSA